MPDDFDPTDPSQVTAAVNIPPPPDRSQAQSLPALLAAIGGLAGNVAGAFTRTGPMGEQALSLSDKLQQEAYARQQQDYQRQVYGIKQQQARNIGQALSQRLDEIDNPAARKEIQTAIDNDNLPFAQGRFHNEIMQQRWEARQDKADRRLQNQDDKQLAYALGDYIRTKTGEASQLQKSLPATVSQVLGDQKFFQSQAQPFSSPQDLQEAYNQRPDVKKKLSTADAQDLYQKYSQFINSKRGPALGSQFLGQYLGFGSAPAPKDAFNDYALRTLNPDDIQAYKEQQGQAQSALSSVSQAHQLRQALLNPKTRAQAREAIQSFLGGGDQPQAPASAPTQSQGSAVGPYGPTVTQNGHTYTWNPQSRRYE